MKSFSLSRSISLLSAAAILATALHVPASASPEPSVSASSAALYEPSGDRFLFTKDADRRRPMASTTKIMTALLLCENADLSETVSVPEAAVGVEGSSLYLKAGENVTFSDLLYGILLRSANDAAAAAAILTDGSVEVFADRMNRRAEELGLRDTHFVNPHGLDDPDHFTTAADLAKLAAFAMENPVFASVASSRSVTLNGETVRPIVNHNKLLRLYPGADGVKTGFTKKSGRCLVGSAEKDGVRLISVTLNAPDDWNDHARLFDYGFSLLERRFMAKPGDFSFEIPVLGGTGSFVKVSNADALSRICLRSEKVSSPSVRLSAYATAPVRAGEILGHVVFTLDGETVGEIDLVAAEDVPASPQKRKFSLFRRRSEP